MTTERFAVYTALMVALIAFAYAITMPTFAHAESTTATSTSGTKVKKSNVNLSCMQTAVETRETALLDGFGEFHDAVEESLTKRKAALKTAWGINKVSDRAKAIKTAWIAWKKDHKSALSELRADRKAAWETFKSTAKNSCKETVPADEVLSTDTAGSISL